MTGVYSIAEAVEDSIKRHLKTIFSFKPKGFNSHQIKSLKATGDLIERNGAGFVQFKDINNTLLSIFRAKEF